MFKTSMNSPKRSGKVAMSVRRFGVLTACTVGLVLMIGVVQAGAAAPTRVLKLNLVHVQFRLIYPPAPIGETAYFTGIVFNNAAQFGKPANARVGRLLLECTVFAAPPEDGVCTGIVHVPDGFFTIEGNGPYATSSVRHYAITGGVGPYANVRGEMTTTRAGAAQVTLYS